MFFVLILTLPPQSTFSSRLGPLGPASLVCGIPPFPACILLHGLAHAQHCYIAHLSYHIRVVGLWMLLVTVCWTELKGGSVPKSKNSRGWPLGSPFWRPSESCFLGGRSPEENSGTSKARNKGNGTWRSLVFSPVSAFVPFCTDKKGKGKAIYPLTRNYYENNSLRIIFRNFEAILYPQNLRETRTFSRNYA